MKFNDLFKTISNLPSEREPTEAFLFLKRFNTNFSITDGSLINVDELVEINLDLLIEETNYFNKKFSLTPVISRLNNITVAPTGGVFI